MLVKVSNRMIGSIKFDAVTSEDHSSELRITENPIESGAAIADHAVVQPKKITINGIMVDHDHASTPLEALGVPHIRGVTDFLNQIPLPFPIINQTQQTLARANRVLSQISYAQKQLETGLNTTRSLAPWLPDFGLGNLLDSSSSEGRIQKCYADLLTSQKSGEPIEIQTGIHLYKNMLIESISVTQSQDGSATFTLSAREVFIVETQSQVTKGGKSSPVGKKKSGRAAIQSAPKAQQGTVQTKPKTQPRDSQLMKIFGG